VDVDNPAGELLPGAYTEVHLKMPNGVSSYILPVSALIFRSEGLQIATVDKDNKINLSSVTLGRDFGAEVEVISGLNDQDQIVMQPPDSLIVGESVNIAPADAPAGGGQGTKPGGSAR
jgi:hypothetical protein